MTVLYIEHKPYRAQLLRNLIEAELIAPGLVLQVPFDEIQSDHLAAFTQVHFCAQIGGWSHSLRLAGWPDDRPCWTINQPWSWREKRNEFSPPAEIAVWYRLAHLLREHQPESFFAYIPSDVRTRNYLGQKSGPSLQHTAATFNRKEAEGDYSYPLGRSFQSDLEAVGYAVCSAYLAGAAIGQPSVWEGIFYGAERVASVSRTRLADAIRDKGTPGIILQTIQRVAETACRTGDPGWMARPSRTRLHARSSRPPRKGKKQSLAKRDGGDLPQDPEQTLHCSSGAGTVTGDSSVGNGVASLANAVKGFWADADWILCRDGCWRAVEPGSHPLGYGLPKAMGAGYASEPDIPQRSRRISAASRVLCPEMAALFVKAYMTSERRYDEAFQLSLSRE